MSKNKSSENDPLGDVVLPKRELEDVVTCEHLRETTIVRNKRSDDAEIPSSLANIIFLHQFGCKLFHERYANTARKGEKGKGTTPTDRQEHER